MTTQEKLEYFREATLEYAKQESYGELARYTQGLDRNLKEHKRRENAHRDQILAAELAECRQQSNRELAKEQIACKRLLSSCEEELTEQLMDEAAEILNAAKATEEYAEKLGKQIRSAVEFAEGAPVVVEIDASDAALLPQLAKLAPEENVTVQVSEEFFGGGTRADIESMNIRLDHSFLGRFEEIREEFRLSHVL